MKREKIINLDIELQSVKSDIVATDLELEKLHKEEVVQRQELNDLTSRIQKLADSMESEIPILQHLEIREIVQLNKGLDDEISMKFPKHPKFPKLSSVDIVISSVAGIIAVAIDMFLVGTPEIVKIYKGGERFDGSLITSAIRKLGDGPLGNFANKLSEICKVPYDISAVKDGMYPQNHRLRSLSHDPFFGLFFAIFDILANTTTFIDNAGCLRIIPNTKFQSSSAEKILAVMYYIGHIVSDLFTARGIPIPGFFLTQFFTNGDSGRSIAEIAEDMYLNGYDMRHLASMGIPVAVKDIILTAYLKITKPMVPTFDLSLSEREKIELDTKLKKEKMNLISNSIAVSGNLVKFFAPPVSCNPCSLNSVEWLAFLNSSINMIRASKCDFVPEEVIFNRKDIDSTWEELIKNT